MRSEVLTEVKMSMLVFWVVTPCGLVDRYQHFGNVANYLHVAMVTKCASTSSSLLYLTTYF
jgi:hypothetical protein